MKNNNVIRRGPQGMRGRSGKFLKIQANSHVDIIPLVNIEDVISIDQHSIWQETGSSPMFACLGDNCPGCSIGDEPQSKSFLPVYSVSDKAAKILSFGKSIGDALLELGHVRGKVIRIKRRGEGLKTKYTVLSLGKKVNVDSIKALDVEKELPIMNRSKIVSLLEDAGLWEGSVSDDEDRPKKKKNIVREAEDEDEE